MRSPNLEHLRFFHAVAHEGNLTRAAQRLNLSQSALSVRIAKLEAQLGHALFDRVGRELRLTEAGRLALDRADAILAARDDLIAALGERGRARQALRVGALATLSRNFLMAFLKPVLGRPDVDVIVRSGGAAELLRGLVALNLDVALLNDAPPPDAADRLVARKLDDQQVSLIGAPARAAAGTDLADLLATHPMVLPAAPSGLRMAFDALAARIGARPQIAAEIEDMALMRLMAREDVGLAVLPPIVVADELRLGQLVELAPLPQIRETFFAVTAERRFPNPLLRELATG
ncbi:LysR family transcriptional regulator [Rubrimonas sp.]|uniref:LysR family transcriptional regulator n=1 Tax=Rubrimonas sp. TaxID=2036015 RepID=UPI002FDDB307